MQCQTIMQNKSKSDDNKQDYRQSIHSSEDQGSYSPTANTYSKLLSKRTSSQALTDLAAGVPVNRSVDVDAESNGTPEVSLINFTDNKR